LRVKRDGEGCTIRVIVAGRCMRMVTGLIAERQNTAIVHLLTFIYYDPHPLFSTSTLSLLSP